MLRNRGQLLIDGWPDVYGKAVCDWVAKLIYFDSADLNDLLHAVLSKRLCLFQVKNDHYITPYCLCKLDILSVV